MSEEVDGICLECPKCGAVVGYDDVQEVDDESVAGCPECGESSPTEDWFS